MFRICGAREKTSPPAQAEVSAGLRIQPHSVTFWQNKVAKDDARRPSSGFHFLKGRTDLLIGLHRRKRWFLDGDMILLIEIEPPNGDNRNEQGADDKIPHDVILPPI